MSVKTNNYKIEKLLSQVLCPDFKQPAAPAHPVAAFKGHNGVENMCFFIIIIIFCVSFGYG